MFSRKSSSGYALLVDVGSGSVGIAVVSFDTSVTTIWSHREHAPLKVIKSIDESSKAVATTIMNAMMTFEGEGRAALAAHNRSAKISEIQATVSAPWSYTVARTINFEKDETFTITEELLSDLASAAGEQAMEEFGVAHSLKSLGVQETSRTTLDTHANGYRISFPNNQKAKQLHVTHVSTLVREEIITTLQEMQQKLFTSARLHVTSYMLANYYVTDTLQPDGVDFCLVDITNEATELGVVRENALQYSTHVAYGRASLAREISAATATPLHQAFTDIRTLHQQKDLHADIEQMLEAYEEQIVALFKETGDRLTIPKHIYLQADAGLSDFFAPIVEKAGTEASKGPVLVTAMTPKTLDDSEEQPMSDMALQVAKSFFHTKEQRTFFEYL